MHQAMRFPAVGDAITPFHARDYFAATVHSIERAIERILDEVVDFLTVIYQHGDRGELYLNKIFQNFKN